MRSRSIRARCRFAEADATWAAPSAICCREATALLDAPWSDASATDLLPRALVSATAASASAASALARAASRVASACASLALAGSASISASTSPAFTDWFSTKLIRATTPGVRAGTETISASTWASSVVSSPRWVT